MALARAVLVSGAALVLAGPDDDRSGEFGCGVGVAGDWPSCSGRLGDTTYNFDFPALMKSAQAKAGRKLWRYDWRGTQFPTSATYYDWTYVAMDWCDVGALEHPDPYGPWPGLMGWNEPNVWGQCNRPADQVAEFVKLAKQFKALGKFVVSPAPTADKDDWMDTFLGVMHDRTDPDENFMDTDFLAYHHYVACDEGKTTADDIWNQLVTANGKWKALIDKWNGKGMNIKGLWMTEVSCGWSKEGQWTGNCGETCVRDTMQQFMRLIQTHSEIKTWAWFGYDNFGNLWDKDKGYALTELGEWYFSNCNHALSTNTTVIQV